MCHPNSQSELVPASLESLAPASYYGILGVAPPAIKLDDQACYAHLNLCSRMKHFLLLAALVTLGSTQFVFFGNGRTAQQSFRQPAAVAPVQPQRFGVVRPQPDARVPVALPSPVSGRFSGTFFRPERKLVHPGKNPLPKEKPEDVKFVEILAFDVIKNLLDRFEAEKGWKHLLQEVKKDAQNKKSHFCQYCKKGFCSDKNLKVHVEKFHMNIWSL